MIARLQTEAPNRVTTRAALIGAVIAISFAAIFFKMTAPTHPLVAAGLRLAIAAAVLAPFVIRARRRGRMGGKTLKLAILGGGCYAIHFGAWVSSLTMTTVASSVTLVTATPLMLALVGWFTGKDKPSARLWIAIGVACVGLAVVSDHDRQLGAEALIGDALALLGAAAMAAYLLLTRGLGEDLDPLAFIGVSASVGSLLLLCTAWSAGIDVTPSSTTAAVYILLAALIPQLIGHSLLTWSVKFLPPTIVGLATVGEPVGSTLLAMFWPGIEEPVSGQMLLGGALVLTAVVITLRGVERPASER